MLFLQSAAMAATTEELLELHGRIRECTACPLHATRTQAVPGYGPVTSRIMAVGEAPGETEDREGKPFVGAAGQLLTRLLETLEADMRSVRGYLADAEAKRAATASPAIAMAAAGEAASDQLDLF